MLNLDFKIIFVIVFVIGFITYVKFNRYSFGTIGDTNIPTRTDRWSGKIEVLKFVPGSNDKYKWDQIVGGS